MNPVEKGLRAAEILKSEVFSDAMVEARQSVMEEWSRETDAQRRESLWHIVQGPNPLVVALTKMVNEADYITHEREKKEQNG